MISSSLLFSSSKTSSLLYFLTLPFSACNTVLLFAITSELPLLRAEVETTTILPPVADKDWKSLLRRLVFFCGPPIRICSRGAVGLWLSASAISAQFFGKVCSI